MWLMWLVAACISGVRADYYLQVQILINSFISVNFYVFTNQQALYLHMEWELMEQNDKANEENILS